MALKNLTNLKASLTNESANALDVAELEEKLLKDMPSLARLTRLLVTEETGRSWAKQDWAFILLSIKVHESLITAQGNSEKHRLLQEVIPARLAVYQAMDEAVYARTEQLMRLIEQDEGFFSRVNLRKSLSLEESNNRSGNRAAAADQTESASSIQQQRPGLLDERRPLTH